MWSSDSSASLYGAIGHGILPQLLPSSGPDRWSLSYTLTAHKFIGVLASYLKNLQFFHHLIARKLLCYTMDPLAYIYHNTPLCQTWGACYDQLSMIIQHVEAQYVEQKEWRTNLILHSVIFKPNFITIVAFNGNYIDHILCHPKALLKTYGKNAIMHLVEFYGPFHLCCRSRSAT